MVLTRHLAVTAAARSANSRGSSHRGQDTGGTRPGRLAAWRHGDDDGGSDGERGRDWRLWSPSALSSNNNKKTEAALDFPLVTRR